MFSPQLPARRWIRGGKESAATAAAEPHGELKAKDMMRRRCFRRLIEYPVNQGRNLVAWTGRNRSAWAGRETRAESEGVVTRFFLARAPGSLESLVGDVIAEDFFVNLVDVVHGINPFVRQPRRQSAG